MAQIPRGDFGNRVARPGPMPSVPNGVTDGASSTIAAGARIGMDLQAEADRQRRQDAMEAKQARDEADRAAALVTLNKGKDALADAHDQVAQGIADGSIGKDDGEGEFATRAQKAINAMGIGEVQDPNRRAVIQAQLTGDTDRLGNSIRKVVTQRNKQDVTSAITQTLEYQQRQYGSDPAKATAAAMQTVDMLAQHSTLTPDQAVKLKQTWKENTQFTAGYEMVSAGRNSRSALDAAEQALGGLPDLDPQKRAVLGDRIAAYRMHLDQKAEIAAARAQREADRRLHQAEAAFNTFQVLADKGGAMAPEFIDATLQRTAGTPYQAGIRALAQQARDTGGIAAQPVSVQQQALASIDAQIAREGRSPGLDKRREQIAKVVTASQADIKNDGLHAALERGLIGELKPMDFSGGPAGLVKQMLERAPLAQRAAGWAGRPVSPLLGEEADQLRTSLDALPPKDRSIAIAGMAGALDPQTAAGLAAQLDSKDKALALAFAYGGSATTAGRFTSELVLRGAQAKKDGTSTKGEKQPDVKVAQWSAHIAAALDGAYPAQTMTDNTREAALLIAHGLASEAGGRLQTKDLDKAVTLAAGGTVAEVNGRRVPLPAGMDESAFEKRLRSVTPQEIVAQSAGLPKAYPGMLQPGNIDLTARPTVKNADGSISTVRSMGVNIEGKEVLLPTVSPEGKVLTEDQAVDLYRRTGKHLGMFASPQASTSYAEALHKQQEDAYFVVAGGTRVPVADFVKSLPGQQLMYAGPGRYAVIVGGRPVLNAQGRPVLIGAK
jgi:hypothetical protein